MDFFLSSVTTIIDSNLTLDRGYDSSRGNGGLQERRQEKRLARAGFGVDSEVCIQEIVEVSSFPRIGKFLKLPPVPNFRGLLPITVHFKSEDGRTLL